MHAQPLEIPHFRSEDRGSWASRRIVLLDGLVKKRQDIPPGVLTRVRRYQRALEAAERQRDKP